MHQLSSPETTYMDGDDMARGGDHRDAQVAEAGLQAAHIAALPVTLNLALLQVLCRENAHQSLPQRVTLL